MDRLYDRDAPGLDDKQRAVCTMPAVWHNLSQHPRSPHTVRASAAAAAKM
jgi:hypothetical protein